VTPAFAPATGGSDPADSSATVPPAPERDAIRQQVRLACILAGTGPVELPVSLVDPDRTCLFAGGDGNLASRPIAAYPLVSFPAEAAAVKRAFDHLAGFAESESLARAIDRLGRSRLARSPVDQALELGIAAEIALMHGDQSSKTEITHKIGGRMSSPSARRSITRAPRRCTKASYRGNRRSTSPAPTGWSRERSAQSRSAAGSPTGRAWSWAERADFIDA